MNFIGRKEELNTLEKEFRRDGSFVVIYGRRRIGKTTLIKEFIKDKQAFYFLATEEVESQSMKRLAGVVARVTGNSMLQRVTFTDWLDLFREIANYRPEEKKVLVIDEFPYLVKTNAAFPSILQNAWDEILKDSNVMLILCGSLISMMQKHALSHDSPLYGRRSAQIRLKPLPFTDLYAVQGQPFSQAVEQYSVTGGVPKYIETFCNYTDIFEAIEENVLNSQSFLYEEPYFLLQKEVSEIGSYFSLIKAIAMGNRKLSDIATNLGLKQTGLTKYLKVLMDLDLVEREVPVTETAPEKSKSGLYRIADNFIAFWFKFVYPYRAYLEKGETAFVLSQIKKGFAQNYASFVYEDVCREKMWELSAANTWSFHFDKVGRYWGAKAGEIDIVGIDTANGNLVLGECKYTTSPKGLSVLHTLQEKSEAMLKLTQTKNVQYILFSTAGFTQGLIDEAGKNPNIKLIERL